jgi:predicted ATPase
MTGRLLPEGELTFVCSEIEDSTRLLRAVGDGYGDLLAEHHRLLDDVLGSFGGVGVSSEGDRSCFVFRSAGDGLAAAVRASVAHAANPWPEPVRVRFGVHTGEAQPTESGYLGFDAQVAHRVGTVGHGGQVVATEPARAAISELPPGLGFRHLGLHHLPGLAEPILLHQVTGPGLAETFPVLRAPRVVVTGAPPLGGLVGREAEIDGAVEALSIHRLVTLVGTGGAGKTRLARELADRLGRFGPVPVFVELASLEEPRLLPSRLAAALGISEELDGDPTVRIAHAVGSGPALVVLDNCEHLLPGLTPVVTRLLEAAPTLTVLATSRSPMGTPGEWVVAVDPLPVFVDGREGPAVELFALRAASASGGFVLDEDVRPHVERICRILDGLPLAIELAAAMTRFLPVAQLATILEERLDVLEGGDAYPERHRTLHAAISGSVELLDADDRAVFPALSVLVGRFGLDDAAAVAGIDPGMAVRLMRDLSDRSLVGRTGDDAAPFVLLDTIRRFGLERLRQEGREEDARERHLLRFRDLALEANRALRGPGAAGVMRLMRALRPNLLAAFDHALGEQRIEIAVELAEGLVDVWAVLAAAGEAELTGHRLLEACEHHGDPGLTLRAVAGLLESRHLAGMGVEPHAGLPARLAGLAVEADDPEAMLRAEVWLAVSGALPVEAGMSALSRLEAGDHYRATVFALDALGWIEWWRGRPEASLAIFDRLRRLAEAHGDPLGQIAAMAGLFGSSDDPEAADGAWALIERVGAMAEELGVAWWRSAMLQFLAAVDRRRGRLEAAEEWLERAYLEVVEHGTLHQIGFVVTHQADNAWRRGDLESAHHKVVEFARICEKSGEFNPYVPEMAAAIAAQVGHQEIAARLLGAAERWREPGGLTVHGSMLPPWDRPRMDETRTRLQQGLDPDVLARAWAQGRGDPYEATVALAVSTAPGPLAPDPG